MTGRRPPRRRTPHPPSKARLAACFSFLFLSVTGFVMTVPQDKLPSQLATLSPVKNVYQVKTEAIASFRGKKISNIEPAAGEEGYRARDRRALEQLIEEETP